MKKTRYGLIAATVVALLVAGALAAVSAPAPKVTGGGQTLNGTTGAGDTIAFVAQGFPTADDADAARGQVQYIDRDPDTGTQIVRHGTVTCLVIESPNSARFGGVWEERDGGGTFEIAVVDNGEGAEDDDDLIGVFPMAEPDCVNDDGDDDDATTALARGNVQVH
jgi:hypothetical protein